MERDSDVQVLGGDTSPDPEPYTGVDLDTAPRIREPVMASQSRELPDTPAEVPLEEPVLTQRRSLPPDSVGTIQPKKKSLFSSIPNIVRYCVIIIIIAFLGFNVFTFLGGATNTLTGILGPAAAAIGKLAGSTVKQGTDTAAVGLSATAGTASKVVDKGVDVIQSGLDKAADRGRDLSSTGPPPPKRAPAAKPTKATQSPSPDDTSSIMQRGKGSVGKGGYCYIGEDRGVRSCSKVNNASECESGQMFSSLSACQNPNMRR